jgi:hypothetical protein
MSADDLNPPDPTPDPTPPISRLGAKIAAFVVLVAVCTGIGIGVLLHVRDDDPKAGKPQEQSVAVTPQQLDALMRAPHVLFQNTDAGTAYGKVEVVPRTDPRGQRAISPITCDRVAAARNVGVCLIINRDNIIASYKGKIFDRHFRVTHTFPLPGLPSRARLSPNGHWAAMTVFVGGDSYASATFSTRTSFVDTATGKNEGDLEAFRVTDRGKTVTDVNRNYWGVTFAADSDTFYATLGRGKNIQLIQGRVSTRSAHTIKSGIECPSLSPDQTRIAYKLRVGSPSVAVEWRLHVLDLRSGVDTTLAENHSVDDQVEWLDDDTILYSLLRSPTGTSIKDTYSLPANGTGAPALYIRGAWSPSVGN